MENWYWIGWLILAVVLAGAELATIQLVSVWFALGAVAAMLVSLTGVPIVVQLAVFTIVSCLALLLSRPLASRIIHSRKTHTNADAVIGMRGFVTQDIDNAHETGRVMVNGLSWSARSAHDEPLCANTCVKVLRIDGVKLIVQPEKEESAATD